MFERVKKIDNSNKRGLIWRNLPFLYAVTFKKVVQDADHTMEKFIGKMINDDHDCLCIGIVVVTIKNILGVYGIKTP